jgi:hypothetical protein
LKEYKELNFRTRTELTQVGTLGVFITLLSPIVLGFIWWGTTNAIASSASRLSFERQNPMPWIIALIIAGIISIGGPIMIFLGREFVHGGRVER